MGKESPESDTGLQENQHIFVSARDVFWLVDIGSSSQWGRHPSQTPEQTHPLLGTDHSSFWGPRQITPFFCQYHPFYYIKLKLPSRATLQRKMSAKITSCSLKLMWTGNCCWPPLMNEPQAIPVGGTKMSTVAEGVMCVSVPPSGVSTFFLGRSDPAAGWPPS